MKYGSSHDKQNTDTSNNRRYSSEPDSRYNDNRSFIGDDSSPRLDTSGILRDGSRRSEGSSRSLSGSRRNTSARGSASGRSSGSSGRNPGFSGSADTPGSSGRRRSGNGLSYRSSKAAPASYRPVSGETPTKKRSGGRKPPVRKPPKKRHGCLSFLIVLVLLIAVAAVAARFYVKNMFGKIENYALDASAVKANEEDPNISKYQNIALFGVDSQDNKITDTGSRTDCIIIASINKSSKKVKLMSIYRDTYVSIDGEYDKINAAYSYGGPELALRTINRNLDLNVTDFATVNFKALADAVDVLGGITLTINSEKELSNLNDYIGNMNKINGGNSAKFDATGTYTFDGNQAVAYARIRYMEGGDHARASHQRLVLEGIVSGIKKKPWKLGTLVNTVLPQCKTSLSDSAMTSLAASMFRAKIADSQAYPFDSEDERYNGIYYGFPLTAVSNVKQAHEYLFGTEDYEPSEELTKISAKIKNVTDYLGLSE